MAATVPMFSTSSINRPRQSIIRSSKSAASKSNVLHNLASSPMLNSLFLSSPKLFRHHDIISLKVNGASVYRGQRLLCVVIASNSDSTELDDQPSAASIWEEDESKKAPSTATEKIGSRVRVKVPLRVFHVPKVPIVDLIGKEGQLMQYVGFWKGKHISANLPFKVAFVIEIDGRGPVKFFAHLKEDEFDYLDSV